MKPLVTQNVTFQSNTSNLPEHRTAQTQSKHIYTPNIYVLSGIRTHYHSIQREKTVSCLRPLGYRDRCPVSLPLCNAPVTVRKLSWTLQFPQRWRSSSLACTFTWLQFSQWMFCRGIRKVRPLPL
jgi:hypothetical protein